ncbi:50S ribosomal protein L18 [Haliangium sp.]|uniref:50S ribosomal protein L18 n=1 Tax=Haliangium sp. TaxID=2663208 RepID=UPI003D152206
MAGHKQIRNPKTRKRLRRKAAIRKRIRGTAERPRLSVFRSAKHIYVQAVDDDNNQVLSAISDLQKDVAAEGSKKERARAIGVAIGKKLLEKNIQAVVFDRNGFIYHGRVKEVADGAREAGLTF